MPKKMPESFNYLANDPEFVPDPEIEEFMEEEIAHAPKDPDLLAQRLHNNTSSSPSDAGGDLDARGGDAVIAKRALDLEATLGLEEALRFEANAQAELMEHANFREAYEAFRAKREPKFR